MADNPMLKFVGLGQAYPDKRAAADRADDFLELSRSFILARAEEQALAHSPRTPCRSQT